MFKELPLKQETLADLVERHTGQDGYYSTTIPYLFLSRFSDVTGPNYGVHNPSLCITVQGDKEILLGRESYKYGPSDYLIASVDLPITGQVIQATPESPYLAFKLEFNPSEILDVLRDSELFVQSKGTTKRAMYVSRIDSPLLDAVIRLVRLLDNPQDIPVLAPLFKKEILYRVLNGEQGATLQQIAIQGSSTLRIKDVIEHIMNNFERTIRVEELAEIASMSVATLHKHFKEVTAMSPIQNQKHLRLQEARRLLLSESSDASDVAFRVGYESPSQFSREYSRMFGLPPREDIKRFRMIHEKTINA